MLKFWKRTSISTKIFICTVAMFSAVLLLLFAGQLFFYEKYYYFFTESNLQKALADFSNEYFELNGEEEIRQGINEFSTANNAFVFVSDKHGNIIQMSSYDMCLQSGGEEYRIMLDNAIQDENFFELKFEEDNKVTVTYLRETDKEESNDIIIPIKIEYRDKIWEYKKNIPMSPGVEYEIVTISGKITALSLPGKYNSKINIQKNEAFDAIMSLRKNGELSDGANGSNKYAYVSKKNELKYSVVSYSSPEHDVIILAVKPLHSVSEAVYVLKDTLILCFVAVLVIALILSVIFSKIVTKPIIKITHVTKKIKQLNFNEKCVVSSKDEVGVLAENINDMSDKLNATINELLQANEQLKRDIEHERILEKQRKEFIAVISHELKTPLGIIRAYSEGLLDGVAGRERYAKVIIEETRKMDKLILDMLEDSKLETGNQQLDLKEADFSEFCVNVLKNYKEPCKAKNITLIENISEEPIIKVFDKDLMERAISNFISNAMRYSENKRIIVTLDENVFSVENEGNHISEEDLPKIWDKFYCVTKSTSHFTAGTGLGLSIAKNILNLHNAEFGVENTELGVRFWFKL